MMDSDEDLQFEDALDDLTSVVREQVNSCLLKTDADGAYIIIHRHLSSSNVLNQEEAKNQLMYTSVVSKFYAANSSKLMANIKDVKLIECLKKLVDYAAVLLKPQNMRPANWSTVRKSDEIFDIYITPFNSYDDVMKALGYQRVADVFTHRPSYVSDDRILEVCSDLLVLLAYLELKPDDVVAPSVKPKVQSKAPRDKSPLCTVCYCKPASYCCAEKECEQMVWCDECNDKWHVNNRRRSDHTIQHIGNTSVLFEPLRLLPANGPSMKTPAQHPPVTTSRKPAARIAKVISPRSAAIQKAKLNSDKQPALLGPMEKVSIPQKKISSSPVGHQKIEPSKQTSAVPWEALKQQSQFHMLLRVKCPQCKISFHLQDEGSINCQCSNCNHNFCKGCGIELHSNECPREGDFGCAVLGLHGHHPRNCIAYLADYSIDELKILLQDNNIAFDCGPIGGKCHVLHVGERNYNFECDEDEVENGMCSRHYTEYLSAIINKHKLEVLPLMSVAQLTMVLMRGKIASPDKADNSNDEYRRMLITEVTSKLPLEDLSAWSHLFTPRGQRKYSACSDSPDHKVPDLESSSADSAMKLSKSAPSQLASGSSIISVAGKQSLAQLPTERADPNTPVSSADGVATLIYQREEKQLHDLVTQMLASGDIEMFEHRLSAISRAMKELRQKIAEEPPHSMQKVRYNRELIALSKQRDRFEERLAELQGPEARPAELKRPEARPAELKIPEARPAQSEKPEARPAQSKTPETRPAELRTPEARPAQSEKLEERPAQLEKPESRPVLSKILEARPVEFEKVEARPVELKRPEARPVEFDKVEARPVELKRPEARPVEFDKVEARPVELKRLEARPMDLNKTTYNALGEKPPTNSVSEMAAASPVAFTMESDEKEGSISPTILMGEILRNINELQMSIPSGDNFKPKACEEGSQTPPTSLSSIKQCAVCFGDFSTEDLAILCCHDTSQNEMGCCKDCVAEHFKYQIENETMANFKCPIAGCHAGGKKHSAGQIAAYEFFQNLLYLVFPSVPLPEEHVTRFNEKLTCWSLSSDANFHWCINANCSKDGYGFIDENDRPRIACPRCKTSIKCRSCKRPWKAEHEGKSCEEFAVWERENGRDYIDGVRQRDDFLDRHGITCPSCKSRFHLAKGGCMDCDCPVCDFKFCNGCGTQLHSKGSCPRDPELKCNAQGLHGHHPRNCHFFLRDFTLVKLTKLLQRKGIPFDSGVTGSRCQVVLEDENNLTNICNEAEVENGMCKRHYTEYLTATINKHKLEVLKLMSVGELERELTRNGITCPTQGDLSKDDYRNLLCAEIQKSLPFKDLSAYKIF